MSTNAGLNAQLGAHSRVLGDPDRRHEMGMLQQMSDRPAATVGLRAMSDRPDPPDQRQCRR
jgi:hypothetical protein